MLFRNEKQMIKFYFYEKAVRENGCGSDNCDLGI